MERRVAGRAFTLLEVMIVIVIILAILGFVGANLIGSKDKADVRAVKIQLGLLKQALMQFKTDFDRFPTDEEGLKALWDKSAVPEEEQGKWTTAYVSEPVPTDKWSSAWGYRQVGENAPTGWFDLWSYGPDKQDGTADDVNLWEGKTADPSDPMSEPPPLPAPSSGGGSGG